MVLMKKVILYLMFLSGCKIGNGLINLQERCKIINAQLEIISSINKGTTTIITLNNL